MTEGYIVEAYPSLEGEGVKLGSPALFFRLAGCNLRCAYCDTRKAWEEKPAEGMWSFNDGVRKTKNPVSLTTVEEWLREWKQVYPTVVFTGGEPLLQTKFLSEVAHLAKGLGLTTRLETNATLAEAWEKVWADIDQVSADIKIPSTSGFDFLLHEHRSFLKRARGKLIHIKVVVGIETGTEELISAAELAAEVAPQIPLVIMPSSVEDKPISIPNERIIEWLGALEMIPLEVRIIPQMHKLWSLP